MKDFNYSRVRLSVLKNNKLFAGKKYMFLEDRFQSKGGDTAKTQTGKNQLLKNKHLSLTQTSLKGIEVKLSKKPKTYLYYFIGSINDTN
jgi:hypothetical protein